MPLDPEDDEFPDEGTTPVPDDDDASVEANVDTTPDPGLAESSSDAPPDVEPQAVIGEAPVEQAGERADDEAAGSEALPEFDPQWRDPFNGLLFIGALTKACNFLGHSVILKSLNVDDMLQVGLVQREYRDSLGDTRAYQAAVLAASVVLVDDQPLPEPLGPGDEAARLRARFQTTRRWYPVTTDYLFQEYLILEADVAEVMKAMGEAHG